MLNQTLAELANTLPGATAIFNKHNLNFCCGGKHTLEEAVIKSNIDQDTILAELNALQTHNDDPETTLQTLSNSDLIDHILTRYHEVHRQQLAELCRLSERVETVHGDHPACPAGLNQHLNGMRQELEQHMHKEEQILFPMLQQGMGAMAQGPISVMKHEHDEHASAISQLSTLTNNLSLPEGACNTWRALYLTLKEFIQDLQRHIEIENNILFTRS